MALISLNNITLSLGGPPLFDGVNLQIEPGDRLCLLGRNGTGETTLMRVLAGNLTSEKGEVARKQGLRVQLVSQEIPLGMEGSVTELCLRGIEDSDGEIRLEVLRLLDVLKVDAEADFAALPGGTKRRVLLAKALASGADLLLLDEPTNHLDIKTILWLEDYLLRKVKSFLFVTHDRAFAARLANRTAELDRGLLFAFSCGYNEFLERRESLLEAEVKRLALFDKRLAEEEAWLRKGVEARLHRNEGRVKALKRMREERADRRNKIGKARIVLQEGLRSGDLIAEMEAITFSYPSTIPVIKNLSTTLLRGDRIGILGPNGSGKTTLLKLILGQLHPEKGTIKLGTNLQVLYFDQFRGQLDLNKTVVENVGDGYDTVLVGGKSRHVLGYLQDFLFSPERARVPVSVLSGGERNRLLLAKLFTKPSNVLVLDEPTNDLDIETLDILEELLLEYNGTILLVSHDRNFINDVVTQTLVFNDLGEVREYAGGWDDYLIQERASLEAAQAVSAKDLPIKESTKREREKPRKMTFKEEKELETLPDKLTNLEKEQNDLHQKMSDPAFFRQSQADQSMAKKRLAELDDELTKAYERWEELEGIKAEVR